MKPTIIVILLAYSCHGFSQNAHTVDVVLNQPDACDSLSIEEQEANSLQVFPLPADNLLTIKSSVIIEEVILYNFLGQQIELYKEKSNAYKINVSSLSEGFYTIYIKTALGIEYRKILINHQ